LHRIPAQGPRAGDEALQRASWPPLDPRDEVRKDLPPVPRDRRPVGYRPGWQIEERLQGLGAVLLGLVGLLVAYGIYTGFLPAGLPPPQQPPGVLVQVPLPNATSCLIPLMSVGSVALIFVGFRRFLDP
jgi:hypothetical protein